MYAEFYHHHHLALSGTAELIGGYLEQSGVGVGGFQEFHRLSSFFSVNRTSVNSETRHG
jgi:hypothetical protein